MTTEDSTVEPVGETDFTSLEKDLENLTTKINAEIARLDNLETLVEEEGLIEVESSGVPGFTVIASIAAISIAAISIGRRQLNKEQ